MNNVSIQQLTTKTAPWDGYSLDVSSEAVPGDWTLVLEVQALTGTARFTFEDSVDAFTTLWTGPSVSLTGSVTKSAPRRFTWTKKDYPDLFAGIASGVLRLSLVNITASTGTVTYEGYIEY